MKTLSVGDALGRYELLCPIAKGGMAQVWAARLRGTRGFQKVVALKTMLPGALADPRMERMFQQEAELAAHIQHPNVAATLELGEDSGLLYLVMEWVNGEPLRYVLHEADQHGGMPIGDAIQLVGQACRGLHAAHEAHDQLGTPLGIVHRDISPHNVLVTYSGTVKLVDFGVAKAESGSDELTERGELKGKLAFMSPEQLAGEPLDRRSDIFALGGILYWLLAGQHPFRADSPAVTHDKIRSAVPPPPPSTLASGCPLALDRVVMRALEFDAAARWPTARDLLEALASALPEAFDNDADLRLSQYMKKLFGDRAQLRVQQLELAQQMVERMRPGPGASGSLPAVSIAASPAPERIAPQPELRLRADERRTARPGRRHGSSSLRSRSVIQTAIGMSGAIAVATIASWWDSSEPETSDLASAPGAGAELQPVAPEPISIPAGSPRAAERMPSNTELARAQPAPEPAPMAAAAAPAAPAAFALSDPGTLAIEALAGASDASPDGLQRPIPRVARKAPAQRPKVSPSPAAASARAPAPDRPAPVASPTDKEKEGSNLDIWDLDSLGGRN